MKTMIIKLIWSLAFVAWAVISFAQSEERQRCGKQKVDKKEVVIVSDDKKQKREIVANIEIPEDYKPPVANQAKYVFPETFATNKKIKRLIKRNRKKKQGCMAANF